MLVRASHSCGLLPTLYGTVRGNLRRPIRISWALHHSQSLPIITSAFSPHDFSCGLRVLRAGGRGETYQPRMLMA